MPRRYGEPPTPSEVAVRHLEEQAVRDSLAPPPRPTASEESGEMNFTLYSFKLLEYPSSELLFYLIYIRNTASPVLGRGRSPKMCGGEQTCSLGRKVGEIACSER